MPNYTINFKAMGSTIDVWLNAPTSDDARILTDIPALFEAWEDRFSRFRPESELSLLNVNASAWQPLSLVMSDLVELALKAAAETDGLFNPLILPALESAGYDHSFEDPAQFVPGNAQGQPTVPGYRELDYDASRRRLRLPVGAKLDLGGLVKGWAAQQAADYLSQVGACLVDAGGDMVAHGSPDEAGGWLVNIPHPHTGETLRVVLLTDAAISTSGSDYRRWSRDGRTFHHVIDPRTGLPAESHVLSATVIAPTGMDAEVWAKAALISGKLPELPSLLIHEDGSVHYSPQFKALMQESR